MCPILKILAQGASESLLRWLYTNAPAAWISALIAVITCLILLRSRAKAKRLVVREIRNSSLITVWPSVREKIAMTFEGRSIGSLAQVDAQIFNQGSDVIQKPAVTIVLPQGSRVLDVTMSPDDSQATTVIDENTATVILPYLNPIRPHKQLLKLSMLVDGKTENIQVTGTGEGWSVLHFPLMTAKQTQNRIRVFTIAFGLVLLATVVYSWYVESYRHISIFEISWRGFLVNLPPLIFFVLMMVWASYLGKKASSRALTTITRLNLPR